jgi:hypothetical protein
MQATEIYSILRAGGFTRAGALGMLGNMMAESSLKPNIVQRGMQNLSDEEYTRKADDGQIDFSRPIGYGLVQWTFPQRKKNLLSYAQTYGVSVGDGSMQVNFCLLELQTQPEYSNLLRLLKTSDDIDTCSDRICDTYERPAVNNYLTRRDFAHRFEREIPDKPKQSQNEPVFESKKQRALELLDELKMLIEEMEG